jgi:hypothetical protein
VAEDWRSRRRLLDASRKSAKVRCAGKRYALGLIQHPLPRTSAGGAQYVRSRDSVLPRVLPRAPDPVFLLCRLHAAPRTRETAESACSRSPCPMVRPPASNLQLPQRRADGKATHRSGRLGIYFDNYCEHHKWTHLLIYTASSQPNYIQSSDFTDNKIYSASSRTPLIRISTLSYTTISSYK